MRGARGRPRGPAESCRRVELLPAPLAGHQTRLAGAEGARRCLCAYTLMQAALPPGRQWRWSAPFPPPCARGRVPGMGGHHQRPGLRQGAVISDAHPSRTTGHPSLARRGAVCRHGGERRATSAARARPVPWDPRPEIDALFSSCGPPRRPARARPANPFPEWGCAYLHVRLRRPRGVCLAAPSCGMPTKYRLLDTSAAVRLPGWGGTNGAPM